mmetsp:Transcript_20125/g.19361  ORF Transcript_20125/g.19361 Transcript_20125/m.19361 type:complete len:561 (-) Transcript_20125:210-1892(-)|eukprot:CAMPEP_0197828876 /NCGR_PEP_ID=MMETSP1437-20131217/5379_1 /TAXON_ID=49252 ORGANISM="Eucampia antarctica, Strain CCMP1452" /NCGR_SAMPLE_ID=MMETSP1437 /ASSEMBLY_ACC=CAM_ASM_001096 /LENGTH=560 /DNA_ID=CAMNT_0043430285 /DNA_START=108 /DNA_END=1790 /DNA_ORIENTATION=+
MRYTSGCLFVFLRSWGHAYVAVPRAGSSFIGKKTLSDYTKSHMKFDLFGRLSTIDKNRKFSATNLLAAKDGGDDGFYDDYDEFISNFNVEDEKKAANPNNSGYSNDRGSGGDRGYSNDRGNNSDRGYSNNRGSNNNDRYDNSRGGGGGRNNNRNDNNFSHDYQRSPTDDVSSDASDFSSTINDMVAARLEFRKTGQFQSADAIRDEMRDVHGVTVWDRERIWTTEKHAFPPKQQQRGDRGGYDDRKPRRQERDFGPHGHDYELEGSEPQADKLAEVHPLIAERLQCKLNRDFRTADAIQEDLRSKYNVEIHDGNKVFRFQSDNGDSDWAPSEHGNKQGRRNKVRQYRMRGTVSDESLDVDLVQSLVEQRSVAKSERDYNLADEIRDELKDKYDIVVDDRSAEWSLSTQQYLLVGQSNVSNKLIQEIQAALAERMEAKKNGDYGTADEIREDLNAKYGVSIDDNNKEFQMSYTEDTFVDETKEENELQVDDKVEENTSDAHESQEEVDADEDEKEILDLNGMDRTALEALTVPSLKEKLRASNLPVGGRKSELIDRLMGLE